jgi:hypothetical protein
MKSACIHAFTLFKKASKPFSFVMLVCQNNRIFLKTAASADSRNNNAQKTRHSIHAGNLFHFQSWQGLSILLL